MAEKVREGGLAAIAESAANRVLHAPYLAAHQEAVEERRALLMQIDRGAFRAACTSLVDADLAGRLPTLADPGARGPRRARPGDAPALNRLIAQNVPGARYVELAGCGRCPPLESPAAFLAAVEEFIKTASASTPSRMPTM